MDFLLPEESRRRYRAFKALEAKDPKKVLAFRLFLSGQKEKDLAVLESLSTWWKTPEAREEKKRLKDEILTFRKLLESA